MLRRHLAARAGSTARADSAQRPLPTEGAPVKEKLRLLGVGVDHDGHVLPFLAGEGPRVGRDVERRRLPVPVRAVEVEPVLRNSGKVDDAEVGGPRLLPERRRLAEIVYARPDELAAAVGIVVHVAEHLVRDVYVALEVA